jgi:hypothetical protein
MPPNSHDVGLRGSTTMIPMEARTITTGSSRASSPPGTTFSGSGGASTGSSPSGIRGTARGARTTSTVPIAHSRRVVRNARAGARAPG